MYLSSLLCTITNTKISTKQIFIKRANLISLRVLNISQLEQTLDKKDEKPHTNTEKHQAGVIDTFDTHEISGTLQTSTPFLKSVSSSSIQVLVVV